MATALLTRRTPLTLARLLHSSSPLNLNPIRDAAAVPLCLRGLHSVASHGTIPPSDPRSGAPKSIPAADLSTKPGSASKTLGYDQILRCHPYKSMHASTQARPRWFSVKAQGGSGKPEACDIQSQLNYSSEKEAGKSSRVLAFSPLEGRSSGLRSESLKVRRMELSQKLTYALIPALLIISKTKLTTSLIILSVYWQIYWFFKEIFLDYVHQEVTRKWVLIYFKLLLLILAKETFLDFNLF